MTLMLGNKSSAVDSNFLLSSVFTYNDYMKMLYKSKLLIDQSYRDDIELKNIIIKYPGRIKTYKEVYFVKSEFYVEGLEGRTKINYDL
jgi:hypothetical protein